MTQIKLRRDTSAAFASSNPILGNGEPAYETDTKKLKIGDGTTAYTQLEYFSAGGGGSSDITATLPIKIVDGVISLEVDGQTIQIVDGKLHANLDELGNEVNSLTGEVTDLSGRVTAAEADILTKQDILTPMQPLTIQNKIISNLVGMEYTGDGTGIYGAYSLESGDGAFESGNFGNNTNFGSSWTATSIPCYVDIPYTFGQIVKVPSGTYGYTWNKSIGKLLADGTFIPICTFYPSQITTSDTLKSFTQYRATWNTKYTTITSGKSFSIANGQAECSYIQFIDTGSTIRCLAYYGNGGSVPSVSINYTVTDNNDIQRIREIQVVRVFPNRADYGVSSHPYPVDRFGLYDGATTLDTLGDFNNLGENLFDLSGQVAKNYLEVQVDGTTITTNSSGQLQANIPSNLTTQGNTFNGANQLVKLDSSGKLPAVDGSNLTNLPGGGSAPTNMVTTDTAQTISGAKTFSTKIYAPNIIISDQFTSSRIKFNINNTSSQLQISRPDNTSEYLEIGHHHGKKTSYIKPCDDDTALIINNYGDGDASSVLASEVKIYGNVTDGSGNKFLTSGDKETIMGYIMPDYSTRTEVPWDTDNTAPTDGYVEVWGEGDGKTSAFVLEYTINGVKTAVSSCYATTANTNSRLPVICPKGTVYSAKGGAMGHGLHFISMKGAV